MRLTRERRLFHLKGAYRFALFFNRLRRAASLSLLYVLRIAFKALINARSEIGLLQIGVRKVIGKGCSLLEGFVTLGVASGHLLLTNLLQLFGSARELIEVGHALILLILTNQIVLEVSRGSRNEVRLNGVVRVVVIILK